MKVARLFVAALARGLVLALMAACSRESPNVMPPLSAFQRLVQDLGAAPGCDREIPMHWSPSMPVPVLVDHRLYYRVFFSGWNGRPDTGIVVHDAEGDALFSAGGEVLECRVRAETGRIIPVQPPMTISLDEFEARLRPLFSVIEEMGTLYASASPPNELQRARVRAFSLEFPVFTDQGHAAAHRALSPDFWAWVEQNSIPSTQ